MADLLTLIWGLLYAACAALVLRKGWRAAK